MSRKWCGLCWEGVGASRIGNAVGLLGCHLALWPQTSYFFPLSLSLPLSCRDGIGREYEVLLYQLLVHGEPERGVSTAITGLGTHTGYLRGTQAYSDPDKAQQCPSP